MILPLETKLSKIYVLKENQLMQQEQIKEQYELINLTRVETAKNEKLFRKLDYDLLQLNATFTALSRDMIMLIYDKNFIFNMLQLRGQISML